MQNFKIASIFAFVFFRGGIVYADGLGGNPIPVIVGAKADLGIGSGGDFSDDSGFSGKVLDFIYGEPVRDGFVYLPFGIHTRAEEKAISNNGLLGVVYNSLAFGTFINSFDDRTWYLASARNIISYNGFGLDYLAGVLYGYKGRLSTIDVIPFSNTFLFKGNLNPVVTISAYYEISEKFEIRTMITPLVVLTGIKYNF